MIRRCAGRTSRGRSRCSGGSRRSTWRKACGAGSSHSAASQSVSRNLALLAAVLVAAAGLAVPASTATKAATARHMLVGIVDDAQTLYGDPDKTYPLLKKLRVQVVRVNLY